MNLTDEQLAEIEARLKAATPWPWKEHGIRMETGDITVGIERITVASVHNGVALGEILLNKAPNSQFANAAFIAHAPDDIAALLAEVKRLRAKIATVEVRGTVT